MTSINFRSTLYANILAFQTKLPDLITKISLLLILYFRCAATYLQKDLANNDIIGVLESNRENDGASLLVFGLDEDSFVGSSPSQFEQRRGLTLLDRFEDIIERSSKNVSLQESNLAGSLV